MVTFGGGTHLFEFPASFLTAAITIGVPLGSEEQSEASLEISRSPAYLKSELLVRLLDRFVVGIAIYAEQLVVVLSSHGYK